MRKLITGLCLLFGLFSNAQVVINEVYGGGGNASAPFTNDFVELYNKSASPVTMTNWSIQYTSATGTAWGSNKTIFSGTIPANGYFLIQLAGGATGVALPTPDATGTVNMSATAGKLVLCNNSTNVSAVANPTSATDPQIIDKVGYGSTATGFETAPAPAPSNTTSVQRNPVGTDNDNNSTDFVVTNPPTPNNSGGSVVGTISVAAGTNATESGTTGSFTISFTPATTASTNINFAYTGTATFNTDYTITYSAGSTASSTSTGTLTVPPGTSSVTVTATAVDDPDVEGTENITLTLSSPPSGYAIGTTSASINITDNDVAPTVSATAGTNAAEPATNGTFNITLSSPAPASGVTVNYTLGGTASIGTDYTDPQSGSVTITSGNTSAVVTMNVINDPDAESPETIILTINNVTSPYVIGTSSASINLISDDFAPISLTGVYSQDFNTLANTGTANPLAIPGWLINETGGGARDNELYAADNGGSNTGDTYSYGATASTERALGSLQSGSLISSFGSAYINNTSSTIIKLRVTYTGEQWRLGATGRNDRLDFQVSTDATDLTTGTWTDVDQLDFVAPNSTGSTGALVGNDPQNRVTVTFDITGLSIPNGATFFVRWNDFNASGADDGLAIDDYSIEANPLDLIPPHISSLSPANNAINVPLNYTASVVFDEPVQKTGTGNIFVKRSSDNSIYKTIAVNSPAVNISGSTASFSISVLEPNTGYYIEIDNGAFEDLVGNDFAGISGNSTWTFTTGNNFFVADFNTCSASSLVDGFTQFSVTGAIVWGCTTFGRDPGAPSGTAPFPYAVQINGFSGGTNVPNVDWLISPSFDLTTTTFPLLSFWSRTAFNGAPLQLKVSTDYTGGDPRLATWTDINGKFPQQTSNIWTLSQDINLSAFKQSNVHFAFVYTSSDDDGARWTIDDVSVVDSPVPPPPSLTVGTTDIQFTFVASGSTADKTFTFTGNDLVDDVTLNATGNFLLSKDGLSFSPSLLYTAAEANNIAETVYVRFAPTAVGQDYEGIVTVHTSSLEDTVDLRGTSIDPATTLEVVNWNLEWFGSPVMDPANDNQQEQNIKTILQNIGADIFCLVEVVDESRLANIVSQMPGYSYVICNYGSHTNPNEGGAGPLSLAQKEAFVYKTSMFSNITTEPLLSQGINSAADISNPAYNYYSSGRFPYMMTADVTLNCVTKHIRFVLVHAKANTSPTATSYDRRKRGADTLYQTLNQLYPNDNIIILGDLNDDLDRSITAGFTTTSWNAFTEDTVNYSALTLPLSLAGKRSTVTFNDVIDHVIVSNEMKPFYMPGTANILNDVANLVTNYGTTTTDHFPAFTRYKFEQPAPPTITCPGDITQSQDAGTCGAVVSYSVTVGGACGEPVIQQTQGLPSGSVFPVGTTTNTFVVTDAAGGTATCSFTVTIHDNTPPTITCPGNITKPADAATCGAMVNYTVTFGDNCTGATIQQTAGLASGSVFPAGTTTNTFVVTDGSGNTNTCSFTVTVNDATAPTFTRPADKTIFFTGTCTYDASPAVTGDVTDEHDNCATGLQATYTDQVSQCGNNIIITRTWTLNDGNGNSAAPQIQTITVTDNNTTYVVYATKEARFGELNLINGSVGVTDANGTAEFRAGSVLPSPNFARAKNISSTLAFVPNRIFSPANDGPNPPFFTFSGTTTGLPTLTISTSPASPVSANYKELRIKKNVTVTITGTLYGKLTIEDGAQVTFNPSGGILNIEDLNITGRLTSPTKIKFGNCTSVRIKNTVQIGEYTQLNVDGPKVTFYVSDLSHNGQFTIDGIANIISVNIYIKKGQLNENGDLALMKGWFIAERVVNAGRIVVWNSNDCNSSSASPLREMTTTSSQNEKEKISTERNVTALNVKVSPNPSNDHFMLRIESNKPDPVTVRITDLSGRLISTRPGVSSNSTISVGSELMNGVYFAEVTQGKERKVVKLVKL